jgi:DNA polymerase I-like protein with 3'-5' exonuclease and polymerase domains
MRKQVLGPTKIPKLAERMRSWDVVVIDCETTATDAWSPETEVLGFGVAPLGADEHFYLPVNHHEIQLNPLDLRPVLEVLEQIPLIGHDIKFDLHMLARLGFVPKQDKFMDVIVMGRLWAYEEHPRLDLEFLGKDLIGYEYITNLKKFRNRLKDFSIAHVGNYCIEDVYLTKLLYIWFRERLPQHLLELFERECLLTRDLFDMEQRGFQVDEDYLVKASAGLDDKSEKLLHEIRQLAEQPDFNPRSPPQVKQLMSDVGIQPVAWSDTTGEPSWNKDAMLEVRNQHPIAMTLAKYRALKYQRSGHVQRAMDAVRLHDGFMHFEFKNWGTTTGRLSGNSQQMPKGWLQFGEEGAGEDVLVWATGDMAKEREFSIRRLHKPREGYALIVADYKQIEMFVLGFYLNDPTFTRWLESGNVHAAVAQDVWGVGKDHPEFEKYYARGKIYNFANVYGQGIKALADALNCTIEEAKSDRQEYFGHMPGFGKFSRHVLSMLRKDGFAKNHYGREYHVDPQQAYKGVNYLVQGTSGDYVKWKLTETRELRRQLDCHVLNTTHDDFVFEIPIANLNGVGELMAMLRKSPFKRDLELDVEWSVDNLVELEPFKEAVA